MKFAIIPARGGSKRIPRKNIRDFYGKPIIAYSIQASLDAGIFDEVMVSTDDKEIAEIAMQYGATVPFMRSKETATDFSTTAEVLLEVLREYSYIGIKPDEFCCIYPANPLVKSKNICAAFNLLVENNTIDIVMSLVRFSYPIQRAVQLDTKLVSLFNPEHLLTRSQDLKPAYHDAGQFYWFKTDEFIKHRSLISSKTTGLILPEWQIQDIDNEDDWKLAELKFNFLQQET